MTKYDITEYERIGKSFHSPAFDFHFNLSSQKQTGFCYAGDWAFILNFKNGTMQQCQANFMVQRIFDNPSEPIQFIPVGNNCKMPWCVCKQFQNYGVIPELDYPSESCMLSEEAKRWKSSKIVEYLDGKLAETNRQFTQDEKDIINAAYKNLGLVRD